MRFASLLALLGSLAILGNASNCPSSDRKVIYLSYAGINWNDFGSTVRSAADAGYNVLIMSFYIGTAHAAYDSAEVWQSIGAAAQQSALSYVHSKGACVLLSVGGATDAPFSLDPASLGAEVAQYALNQQYDGIDFDIENVDPGFTSGGVNFAQWLISATNAARNILGSSRTITHAPQAPYFGNIGGSQWTGSTGGYSTVEQQTSVDWYNVQFYNQGPACYVDFGGLFQNSCTNFPGTSVQEIASSAKMPLNKIVVGKPVTTADAGTGFLSGAQFGDLLRQAQSNGIQIGGYMGWKWEAEAATWPSQIGNVAVA